MKKVCRNLMPDVGPSTFTICKLAENVGNMWLYSPHDRARLQPVPDGRRLGFSLGYIKVGFDPHNLESGPRRQYEMLSTERQKTYRRSRMAIGRHDADALRIEGHRADRFAPSLNIRKNNS